MGFIKTLYGVLVTILFALFGMEVEACQSKTNGNSKKCRRSTQKRKVSRIDDSDLEQKPSYSSSTSQLTQVCSEDSISDIRRCSSCSSQLGSTFSITSSAEVFGLLEEFDLYLAAKTGDTAILLEIFRLGAIHMIPDVNRLFPFKADDWPVSSRSTALCIASSLGHYEFVELLLQHPQIDPNLADEVYGWSPLHLAANERELEVINALLSMPTLLVNIRTKGDLTALLIATEWGFDAVTALLLADVRTDVNLSRKEWTSLHVAVDMGYATIVQQLLSRSDIDVNKVNDAGDSALHLAAYGGHLEIVRLLTSHASLQINILNYDGDTPFDCVCRGYFVRRNQLPLIEATLAARGGMPHTVLKTISSPLKSSKRSSSLRRTEKLSPMKTKNVE